MEDRAEPPSWLPDGATSAVTEEDPSVPAPEEITDTSADLDPVSYDGSGSYLYEQNEGDGERAAAFDFGYTAAYDSGYTAGVTEQAGYNDTMSASAGDAASVPPYPAEIPSQPLTATPVAQPAPDAARFRPKSQAVAARRANLVLARLEPWSVMKFSFLISLVAWVVLFVAVALLYYALSALGVFTALGQTLASVTSSQGSSGVDLSKWTSASRVLGYTMLIGAVNVVIITALSTVGAMIYNLVTHVGGGIEITLRETD